MKPKEKAVIARDNAVQNVRLFVSLVFNIFWGIHFGGIGKKHSRVLHRFLFLGYANE